MAIRLICDSTMDAPAWVQQRFTVVPLTVCFGDTEYVDGVTLDRRRFYEMLISEKQVPTTSQAAPAAFEAVFSQVAQAGDSAVVLTLASKLSGTYQSAKIAAAEYDGIYIVDTETVSIGIGILAQRAAELADAGRSAAEIAACLESEKRNVRLMAVVDTLTYLCRGGRLSKTAALAGGLLNIKPVLVLQDGEIRILGKGRGMKQAGGILTKQVAAENPDMEKPVHFGYTGLEQGPLEDYMKSNPQFVQHNSTVSCIGSVIGTHAGPGGVALAFFNRR